MREKKRGFMQGERQGEGSDICDGFEGTEREKQGNWPIIRRKKKKTTRELRKTFVGFYLS